jgi:DNA replication protein DnaC
MEMEKPDYVAIVEKIMQESPDTTQKETRLEPSPSQENTTKGLSLWMESRITDRHRDFTPEQSDNAEWNAQWCKLSSTLGSGVIAVIIGNRGAGKTQMSVCAIRQTCKSDRSALYSKAMNFFLDVRSSYQKESSKTEREIIQEYLKPSLLVIDAIENRSDSSFENLLLNYLIDMRYDAAKDTILIGNLNETEFAASMGLSIVDRIHECGIKIVCTWKSFRRK